ncbi:Hypothetical predicted protein [Drosophila guanche]|uniref:Uncharacterized protein n=1 Tax=Drosophila guanche TaxID=7266 RepID=A0A3B0KD28_DROGU|nr:Hypothetical predicted protein [Drosophila guanche]
MSEDQPTAEGSQQLLEEQVQQPSNADTRGGSDADVQPSSTGGSLGPSQTASKQYLEDSKPKPPEKQNPDKEKEKKKKPSDGGNYWELGRGIIFFCVGSIITYNLTGIVLD